MKKVILISFDAVSDSEFETLLQYPNIRRFMEEAAVVRHAQTVFLSNTYPIHTSVVTGHHPKEHGIISNLKLQPYRKNPDWHNFSSDILKKTLWQAAYEKGKRTAAVMWPVTAGAKEIAYNFPEILAKPNENQLLVSLKAGSRLFQVKEFLRHGRMMKTSFQPGLDRFATMAMCDIIREKKPELMLLHLTCYDSLCHKYGRKAPELKEAYETLNESLGKVLNVIDEDTTVIVFSDHGQLTVHDVSDPNKMLESKGLLKLRENGTIGACDCYFECCGGSAFFRKKKHTDVPIEEIKQEVSGLESFERFLTKEELVISGRSSCRFGFCAKPGYCYEAPVKQEKGNHGYPLDYKDYEVFYAVRGKGFEAGKVVEGGSLLEIAPLAAKELMLSMGRLPFHAKKELYKESSI